MTNMSRYSEEEIEHRARALLLERGVEISDIVELVLFLQRSFFPDLTEQECEEQVQAVLKKREVQNTILTAIELDILAEQKQIREPLLEMLTIDDSLYGLDEIMALSILNIYGSIGFTNYGFIDRSKPGILEKLNDKSSGKVHTFLDDIVGAIAAAAASRLAHNRKRVRDHKKES